MGIRWVRESRGGVIVLDGWWLASRGAWQELADVAVLTCARGTPGAVLLDVRGASFTPAAREAEVLASGLAGSPVVAILSGAEGSYWSARMVATSAGLRGSQAAAFLDESQAWVWLYERVAPAGREGPAG
jgi:hypothetical protein